MYASQSIGLPSKITFYNAPGACSLAIHIILYQISLHNPSITFSVRSVDIGPDHAHIPESFRFINPKMRVPVLILNYVSSTKPASHTEATQLAADQTRTHQESTEIITEVPAIAMMLSSLTPELQILGSNPIETAKALEWMVWLSGTLHTKGYGCLVRPARFTDDQSALESTRAKGRSSIIENYNEIEAKLTVATGPEVGENDTTAEAGVVGTIDGAKKGEVNWTVGGRFTAVEAYLFVFYRWGNGGGFGMRANWPKYTGLMERVAKIPAVIKALEAEGRDSTL